MITERYESWGRETSINVAGSTVKAIRDKEIRKTGIRVYRDGCIGVAGYMGHDGEDRALARALAALERGTAYPCEPSADLRRSASIAGRIYTGEQFLAEVEDTLAWLRENFGDYLYTTASLKAVQDGVRLANDARLDLRFEAAYLHFALLFKKKDSADIIDGCLGYVGKSYDRRVFRAYAGQILSAFPNRVALPAEGKMPVVFLGGAEMLGKLAAELNGRTFGEGASLFSGKTGQRLFSERFTLVNSRDPEEHFAPFFDAEGTVPEGGRHALIEAGVLRTPYTDKRNAARFGLPRTANGAAAYDDVPTLGPHGLSILPSDRTIRELLGGEPGVLVLVALGGDSTSDGGWATPVQVSFLFDGERLLGRLPGLQVRSHIYEMFGDDWIGVSSDPILPLTPTRYAVARLDVRRL